MPGFTQVAIQALYGAATLSKVAENAQKGPTELGGWPQYTDRDNGGQIFAW